MWCWEKQSQLPAMEPSVINRAGSHLKWNIQQQVRHRQHKLGFYTDCYMAATYKINIFFIWVAVFDSGHSAGVWWTQWSSPRATSSVSGLPRGGCRLLRAGQTKSSREAGGGSGHSSLSNAGSFLIIASFPVFHCLSFVERQYIIFPTISSVRIAAIYLHKKDVELYLCVIQRQRKCPLCLQCTVLLAESHISPEQDPPI